LKRRGSTGGSRPQLNASQRAEIRESFDLMDKAEPEMMAPSEFYRAMCALGFFPPQEEAEAMFLELDTDGNGKLDFDEFSQFMSGCVLTFYSLLQVPLCEKDGSSPLRDRTADAPVSVRRQEYI